MPTVGFPLLLIPIAIFNIFVFLMPGVSFSAPVLSLRVPSGSIWSINFGDILIALGILLMLFEFARASKPGAKYLTDHFLSLLVCAGAIAEFLLLAPFATSAFATLFLLASVDFLSGSTQALRHRRNARLARHYDEQPLSPPPIPEKSLEPASEKPAAQNPDHREPSFAVEGDTRRATAEVITPAVDSVPDPAPKIDKPAFPLADNIPDPEPVVLPSRPTRSISEWSVNDLLAEPEGDAQKTVATDPGPPRSG